MYLKCVLPCRPRVQSRSDLALDGLVAWESSREVADFGFFLDELGYTHWLSALQVLLSSCFSGLPPLPVKPDGEGRDEAEGGNMTCSKTEGEYRTYGSELCLRCSGVEEMLARLSAFGLFRR